MSQNLQEIIADVDSLYLDPNNPRYLDVTNSFKLIPLERVTEEMVQNKALERLLDPKFEVEQLKDSIRNIGFLTIDRLVVRRLPENEKYMVIEGNRRLAAVKSLLKDHENGEIDLPADIIASLRSFPVLLLENSSQQEQEHLGRIFQGIRHVSGVKPWGPYQQGHIIAIMIDDGRSQQEIKETLGLPIRRINVLRRAYYALQQMRSDTEFGEEVKPQLFSSFDEVFKTPRVRDWMQWNDESNQFEHEANRKLFYGWIVGMEEDGRRCEAKIVDSKDIRNLPDLMDNPSRFRSFNEDPNMTIEQALAGIVRPAPAIEWRERLTELINTLNQIPAVDLQGASDSDLSIFEQAKGLCDRHTRMIRSYRQGV
jgi:hypothetical protein